MEGQYHHAQISGILLLLLLLPTGRPQSADEPRIFLPVPPLQNGDLLYRYGNGFFSACFRDVSTREKRYSHVGIVVRQPGNDSMYVVHAEASELTGGGFVRTEALGSFLTGATCWAAYRLRADSAIRAVVANRARNYARRRIPFDAEFDAGDSTAFYCTELVAHCLNPALGKALIQARTNFLDRPCIAIDDTYLLDEIEPVFLINQSNCK